MDVDIGGQVNKALRSDIYQWGTGALGFVYGATADVQPSQASFTGQLEQRAVDTIKRVTGFNMNIAGIGSGLTQKFNPTGFINNGFWVAVGLEVADALIDHKFLDAVKRAIQPAAVGYSLGGLFDDTPSAQNVSGNVRAAGTQVSMYDYGRLYGN